MKKENATKRREIFIIKKDAHGYKMKVFFMCGIW